ncbi:hypothetical protein C2S52_013353 [Perilla frutescens var. hirtella]|nr:hypothetical protein C2S51_015656 [Perilla frutescens var. frutescens]KAH6775792.1 hypothetical protein C2S52_013353 [Perilla frutescens var. hirtella]
MDPEIQTFTKIWLIAAASLIFCHQIASRIPSGAARLLSLLPIIYLFTTLPLGLSSVHLGGPTIFYLVWLGNFKLLLFSFGQAPLSTTPPLSLLHFISIALLPIKLTKQTQSNDHKISKLPSFLLKCGLLAFIVSLSRAGPSHHGPANAGPDRAGVRAAVQRAVFSDVAPRFLGPPVESHGDQYSTPHRIPTRTPYFYAYARREVGPAAGDLGDFLGVGADARGDLLLPDTCEAHVGGDLVLCFTRVPCGGGGGTEEGVDWPLEVAQGGFGAADGGDCGGERWLAVFPAGD